MQNVRGLPLSGVIFCAAPEPDFLMFRTLANSFLLNYIPTGIIFRLTAKVHRAYYVLFGTQRAEDSDGE